MSETAEKTRFSDAELLEFKTVILEKLAKADKDFAQLKSAINHDDGNDIQDTSPTFKTFEEGAAERMNRGGCTNDNFALIYSWASNFTLPEASSGL